MGASAVVFGESKVAAPHVENIPHIDPKPITKIEDIRSPNRPSYPFPLSHWTVTEDPDMM